MPAGMKDDLMASVRISEQAINDSLAAATLAGRVG
jgi:hypothetical protein